MDRDAGILAPDWEYRLPTEIEWEYACRAGASDAAYGPLDEIAWHFGNSGQKPNPVAQKMPNAWGFYDMIGNVWEMCQDIFWKKHQFTACRGGGYFNTELCCRAACRSFYGGGRYCGFRLAAAPIGEYELCPPLEDFTREPREPTIFDAFEKGDLKLAEQILAKHPEQLDSVDSIPPSLHGCVYNDDAETLTWLLDHGADIELLEQDYGASAIITATVMRRPEILRILVERGADPSGCMDAAQRGSQGAFEDDPSLDRDGYNPIIALLTELGIE